MNSFDSKKNVEDSIKGGKPKTTKSVPGCHGYHKTCWWNSGWCPCQGLRSLQRMDQGVIQQNNFMATKGNKITQRQMQIYSKGLPAPVYAALRFNR